MSPSRLVRPVSVSEISIRIKHEQMDLAYSRQLSDEIGRKDQSTTHNVEHLSLALLFRRDACIRSDLLHLSRTQLSRVPTDLNDS